jgi:hypothetical protein
VGTISFAVSSVMFVGIFFQPCRLHVHAPKTASVRVRIKRMRMRKRIQSFQATKLQPV